jgi:hypothetical protein
MSMSLSLGCSQRLEQRQALRLSQRQKLGLKFLLSQRQILRHPEFPNPAKGLEGMLSAHEVLQRKQCAGVLIGGLSEAIWNQRRTREQLYAHKDTDVLILGNFNYETPFEGGIDWWYPTEGRIKINHPAGTYEIDQKWYSNENGAVLRFGINQSLKLPPGLYLPSRHFIVDMRLKEALAAVGESVEVDSDATYIYRSRMLKSLGKRVPKFLEGLFKGFILDSHYEESFDRTYALSIDGFDNRTIIGINSHLGRYLEPSKEKEK